MKMKKYIIMTGLLMATITTTYAQKIEYKKIEAGDSLSLQISLTKPQLVTIFAGCQRATPYSISNIPLNINTGLVYVGTTQNPIPYNANVRVLLDSQSIGYISTMIYGNNTDDFFDASGVVVSSANAGTHTISLAAPSGVGAMADYFGGTKTGYIVVLESGESTGGSDGASQADLATLEAALRQAIAAGDTATVTALNNALTTYQSQVQVTINNLQAQIDALTTNRDDLIARIAALEQQGTSQSTLITQLQQNLTTIQQDLTNLTSTVTNLSTLLTNVTNRVTATEQAITNLQTSLTLINNQLTAYGLRLDAHGALLEQLGVRLDQYGNLLDAHGNLLAEHGALLGLLGARLDEHGNLLDAHGNILIEHSALLSLLGARLDEHGNLLDAHGNILIEHSALLSQLGARLDEHGNLLDSHGNILIEHGAALSQLSARLDAHGNLLDSHGNILIEHGALLSQLSARLDAHGNLLDSHGNILIEHGALLSQLSTRLDAHGNLLDAHGNLLIEHSTLLSQLGLRLDAHDNLLDEHGKLIAKLTTQLKNQDKKQQKNLDRTTDLAWAGVGVGAAGAVSAWGYMIADKDDPDTKPGAAQQKTATRPGYNTTPAKGGNNYQNKLSK